MKWAKEYYGNAHQYISYVSGRYAIRQTHGKNIFTGKEMSHANQIWKVFKDGTEIGYGFSFKEAKAIAGKDLVKGEPTEVEED